MLLGTVTEKTTWIWADILLEVISVINDYEKIAGKPIFELLKFIETKIARK